MMQNQELAKDVKAEATKPSQVIRGRVAKNKNQTEAGFGVFPVFPYSSFPVFPISRIPALALLSNMLDSKKHART